ncbi:MAG: PASTA domain-containing protein [Ruminococcaceae bacterium]|nr:PASTA domain-containing protein [Oscillospiraceae bacterium]
MADRICDNCMSPVPIGTDKCPKCGILFENTNPGGALPNGWVLGGRYTVGRYIDIDGEGVLYSAIDGNTLQRVTVKEFMPVTLCASRSEAGAIQPKPGCEVLFKTTRMDFADLYGSLLRLGLVEGLVQVLDVLEENNTAYAVLEKVEGPTLAEYLTKKPGPIDPPRAIALLRPVMNGAETMHNANLIHRGISPENIILESGGTAKLFGYATLALRQQGSELKPKLYPGYSAPEQYAASEFEGRYTDVYALGAVLYRLVTGGTPEAADERKLQDTQRGARTLNKEVPSFLSAAIARAMRLLPAERIQDVGDLRLALSGEGGQTGKGGIGLTRQQIIIGGVAVGVVVVAVIIILLVSLLGGGGDDSDAFSQPDSSLSSSSVSTPANAGTAMPNFVGKKYSEIIDNVAYTSVYTFADVQEQYDPDVEAGRVISQTPAAATQWDGKTPVQLVVSKGAEAVKMPDFVTVGTSQEEAEAQLKELDLEYTVLPMTNTGEYEEGTVLKTDPEAGTEVVPKKDKVIIYVAGDVATIPMPDVVGKTQAAAETELNRQNIKFRIETVENDGTHTSGTVASTEPTAGNSVATGATIVNVKVYDVYRMPDLSEYIGQSPEKLYKFLTKRNIAYSIKMVDNTDPALNGLVQSLDYVINAEVNNNTVVTVYLYKDAPEVPPAPNPDSNVPPDDGDDDDD